MPSSSSFLMSSRSQSTLTPPSIFLRCPYARPFRILIVGAEQDHEFARATQLKQHGNRVTVVNPIVTTASQYYSAHGGDFRPIRLEHLPTGLHFDLIEENYPYPLGRTIQAVDFARQRLARLSSCGVWKVTTENREFADALMDIAEMHSFRAILSHLSLQQAPPASARYIHPQTKERYKLLVKYPTDTV